MGDPLPRLTLTEFLERLASRAPTPGGGSASALAGAVAAALCEMVLELTADRVEDVDATRVDEARTRARDLRAALTELVELDAAAYDGVVAARRLPRGTDAEAEARRSRVAEATREATRIPVRIAESAGEALAVAERVTAFGSRSAISDIGVAAELAAAAVRGAALNVRINLPFLAADDPLVTEASSAVDRLLAETDVREVAVRAAVAERLA